MNEDPFALFNLNEPFAQWQAEQWEFIDNSNRESKPFLNEFPGDEQKHIFYLKYIVYQLLVLGERFSQNRLGESAY